MSKYSEEKQGTSSEKAKKALQVGQGVEVLSFGQRARLLKSE